MPNWVKCEVTMRGLDEADVFSRDDENRPRFDFNKIIPMPKELKLTSGSIEDKAIKAYMKDHGNLALKKMMDAKSRWNVIAGDYSITEEEIARCAAENNMTVDELIKLGERYCLNVFHYGFSTWYDWCCEHWGTKWNACETEFVGTNTIKFQTAWSAPFPVLAELSKMFPDRTVYIRYADEDVGRNAEMYGFKNGEVTFETENDEQASINLYMELWGEHDCFAKDEQGKWYRKDCETCHGCD